MDREIGRVWGVVHEKRDGEIIWNGELELVMKEGKRTTLTLYRLLPHFSRNISDEQGYR